VIAGIISFKNEIKNPDLILKMTGMLKHRGPDDGGVRVAGIRNREGFLLVREGYFREC